MVRADHHHPRQDARLRRHSDRRQAEREGGTATVVGAHLLRPAVQPHTQRAPTHMDELQGGARRMIKKQVYLVRHGESVTNATKIHFGPSVVHNRHGDEPEVRRVWHEISTNAHVPGWRHSDEENFTDLLLRAKQALAFLEALPEECVIVVSHGMTLKMLLAHILLGDRLDGRIFWDCFVPAKNIANTGIMHVEFTDRFDGKGLYWKLVSWNDHAHLDRDELT